MVFGIFAILAEFERDLIRERTMTCSCSGSRAQGRSEFALAREQVRFAQAAMSQRDTSVSDLCKESSESSASPSTDMSANLGIMESGFLGLA